MRVFGTLFLASAVLLNSIEFSIQTNPPASSPRPPPPAKGPPKPPPHSPRHQSPKPAKGASGSTPEHPVHPAPSHPAPSHPAQQPNLSPHPGSSSANPPPAPGAPSGTPQKGSTARANSNPDLGNWPRILTPGTQLGHAKAPMVPTGYISLDATYNIIGTTLDKLGFKRLTLHSDLKVVLEFRKYTFFSAQKLVLYLNTSKDEPTMIPDVEHIVIVNGQDFALAILMPNGNILGVYSGNPKGRKKVNTIDNEVKNLEGDEKEHVVVGLRRKLPSTLYKMTDENTNSLLKSYGRKHGERETPLPPLDPTKQRGRPKKRPRQEP